MDDVTKPYELTFEERSRYLYACVKAETINEKIAMDYLRKVAARCEELETTHLILYRDIPAMLLMGHSFLLPQNSLK